MPIRCALSLFAFLFDEMAIGRKLFKDLIYPFLAILSVFLTLYGSPLNGSDTLLEKFQNPPTDVRPFVRWWWNGSCVTEQEILRELDVMQAAGIGGVEINTIAMPDWVSEESLSGMECFPWLSPGWIKMIKTAAEGAKKRGMTADLIVGSGWPFGGQFLESGEQIQIVTVKKRALKGPSVFNGFVADLVKGYTRSSGQRERTEITSTSPPKLLFLRLIPAEQEIPGPGTDLMNRVRSDGTVQFKVTEGDFLLYAGAWREGHRKVVRGAPGADGPVVDHFNKKSVLKYLGRMSEALSPAFAGGLGTSFRAMFCDSLELGEANWTQELVQEFQKRRGYDPTPYLPYMIDHEKLNGESRFSDLVRRFRYDFNRTVVDLFMENFVQTFTEWCNRNGVKSRMQAYGRESHPVDTSFLVDFPEGETWIWGAEKNPLPTMINRFVASAGHLSGKRRISAESMTNPFTPLRILPGLIKKTDDLSFISGITHTILHGYNYSPPEAGFPGWVQFGSYFSDQNSLWPYFRYWSDYNSRLSSVLQNSDAQARVAMFSPDADIWSNEGRLYFPFAERERPGYIWDLWKAIHQNGHNAEYVSDRVLAEARIEEGKIRYGNREYEILLLLDTVSILPETAQKLAQLAGSGGKIVFIGETPHRSPSFQDHEKNDQAVRDSVRQVLASENSGFVESPRPERTLEFIGEVLTRFGLIPDIKISSPDPLLSQIYHKVGERDIYFLASSDEIHPISVTAKFRTGKKQPWRWDPQTGERFPYPSLRNRNELKIYLEPLESILLVFEPESLVDVPKVRRIDSGKFRILEPDWKILFKHAKTGLEIERNVVRLFDPGQDSELNSFGGTIVYRAEFETENLDLSILDLGEVHGVSEVFLNGKKLGVRWYGRHYFDTSEALQTAKNRLEIRVTTHLGNYVRTLAGKNESAKRWAWWYPIEKVGMLGPVRMYGKRNLRTGE